MTAMYTTHSDNLDAIKSDGTAVATQRSGASKGVTLGIATYYVPIGSGSAPLSAETPLACIHLKWASALAATITIETSCFPQFEGGLRPNGISDVTDWSTTVGDWVQENPSTAYVNVVGSGNSVSNLTITAGGSAAGAATIHLGNLGSRRCRVKIVATTGGLIRIGVNGKAVG